MERRDTRRSTQAVASALLIALVAGTAGSAALLTWGRILETRRDTVARELRKVAESANVRLDEVRTLEGEALAREGRRLGLDRKQAASFGIMARCSVDVSGVVRISDFRQRLRKHDLLGRFQLDFIVEWRVESVPVPDEEARIQFSITLIDRAAPSPLAAR